jgi:hypothetical protein
MTEKRTTLKVPPQYAHMLTDLRLLKSDGNNPNRMTIKQHEELWNSLVRHGWMSPIVADEDLVFCDGEQRAQVCLAHGEFYAPVLRAKMDDNHRCMLRLLLNKLKGKHSKDLEAEEYQRLIKSGEKVALESMLTAIGEKLPDKMTQDDGGRSSIPELYEIIVECKDEADQKVKFERFKGEGLNVRILTL